MNTANNKLEIEYYTKILNFFKNQPTTKEAVEIWKNKSIIELMKVLERTKNNEFVQNALIVIISLFEQMPPDLYNNRGINTDLLDEKERKGFLKLMKSEFINNNSL